MFDGNTMNPDTYGAVKSKHKLYKLKKIKKWAVITTLSKNEHSSEIEEGVRKLSKSGAIYGVMFEPP